MEVLTLPMPRTMAYREAPGSCLAPELLDQRGVQAIRCYLSMDRSRTVEDAGSGDSGQLGALATSISP